MAENRSPDIYETGYYNNQHRGSKTHVTKNGKPLCNYKIPPTFRFQQCSKFIYLNAIECEECLEKAKKILEVKHDGH